jgi:tripartite-type tricarboxylate transporter receptor subunit TctC
VVALLAVAGGVHAADGTYPHKPLRVLVPAPPGGASDVILRTVTQKLAEALGQPVVADNRPGAHGLIAMSLAAQSRPDGYTLIYGTVGTLAINTSLYRKLPYRMPQDFAPLTQFAEQANVALVNAEVAAKSLSELVRLAKAKPGALTFGSAGTGSGTHLGPAMFCVRAGIDIRHVPYKGAAAAITGLAGGEVQVLFVSPVTANPFIANGKVRALAVSSPQRIPQMPAVPTIAESGYPDFAYVAWSGMLARAGSPQPILDELYTRIAEILRRPQMQELISRDGAKVAVSASREAFGAFIREETARWAEAIARTGTHID